MTSEKEFMSLSSTEEMEATTTRKALKIDVRDGQQVECTTTRFGGKLIEEMWDHFPLSSQCPVKCKVHLVNDISSTGLLVVLMHYHIPDLYNEFEHLIDY